MVEKARRKFSTEIIVKDNPVSRYLFTSTSSAWLWLIIRIYVGYQWLKAGWGKVTSEVWTGAKAGAALQGFINEAIAKSNVTTGHADVTGWYANYLEHIVLPNAKVFSYIVAYGELLVGLGLILGLLTGIAAFFAGLMNVSYLLAGTLSTNPLLFVLATWLVLAWKVAGWYGLDRWALPMLGTPWEVKQREQRD